MKYNLIIGGVHKSGTTSLYKYLMDHPKICGSKKKEIHHFTPLRYGLEINSTKNYNSYFTHCDLNVKYLLEASPSYLYGTDKIASRLRSDLDKPKLIFILRNPTSRFISYYKHCEGKFLIPKNTTFSEFFDRNRHNLKQKDSDDPFYRGLREGVYIDFLPYWINEFRNDVSIVFLDDLISNPKHVLKSLTEWLNIDTGYYDDYIFEVENRTVRRRFRYLTFIARYFNRKFEHYLRSNKSFKKKLKKIFFLLNSDPELPLDESTIKEVNEFYKQKNRALIMFLEKNGYNNLPTWLKN